MATTGTASNIPLGPGTLYVAPVGSAEPTTLAAAWPAAWQQIGYTKDGHTFSSEVTRDDVIVAESVTPVASNISARVDKVSFEMAEVTARNMTIAQAGGTVATSDGVTRYDPPTGNSQTPLAFGFESEDGAERFVWRNAVQSGTVTTARKKGADYATLPVELTCYAVSGQTPWTWLMESTRSGGTI
jgi:hypothetical protein